MAKVSKPEEQESAATVTKTLMSPDQSVPKPCCCPPGSAPYLAADHDDEGVIGEIEGVCYYQVGSGKAGLLICPDVWGWNGGRTRAIADDFAKKGLSVWVPKLLPPYQGGTDGDALPSDFNIIERMNELGPLIGGEWNPSEVVPKALKVVEAMKAAGVSRIGCIGVCFGGWIAMKVAAQVKLVCVASPHPSIHMEGMINGDPIALAGDSKCPWAMFPCGSIGGPGSDPDIYDAPDGALYKALEAKFPNQNKSKRFSKMAHGFVTRGSIKPNEFNAGSGEEVQAAVLECVEDIMSFFREMGLFKESPAEMDQSPPPSNWVIICCEVAGKKTGGQVVREQLVPAMQVAGLTHEVVYTECAGHAVELAKTRGSCSCGLIAVGGDGTIHEVMDGLLASGKLQETPLGLLSQGTVNAYAISADLPDATALPELLAKQFFRPSSLMHITDNTSAIGTLCFEAIYIGLGYNGTRGAQAYRNSFLGPMFGIIKANFADNLWPKNMAVTGTMDMVLKDGSHKTLNDTFYWIIVCMRNPYNGCLTDSMFVSYITLKGFPGFKRMVGKFLAPPFEFYSGLTSCFEGHFEVKSFEWRQTNPETIGVCLDGDPTDMGNVMKGELLPNAWTVSAPMQYPTSVRPEFVSVGSETEVAARWIKENPPPAGVKRTRPGTQPAKAKSEKTG